MNERTRRETELTRIANALDDLYKVVGELRDRETTKVYVDTEDLENRRDFITVEIGQAKYRVNVDCDSVTAMVIDVVKQTVSKI